MKSSLDEIPSDEIPSTSETRSVDADQVGGALSDCRAHSQVAKRYLVRRSSLGQMCKGNRNNRLTSLADATSAKLSTPATSTNDTARALALPAPSVTSYRELEVDTPRHIVLPCRITSSVEGMRSHGEEAYVD